MAVDPVQERLYNVRAAVPEHVQVFARWRQRSDAFKQSHPGARLDLAYGDGPQETLDLFPAAAPNAPLMMFLHGGYWQAMDKADNAFVAEALVAAGVHVAVVNYALTPIVSLEYIVAQVGRALVWLHDHAMELGGDPDRLFVAGHSAGGHLTAMLMTQFAMIRGGLALSGLFDLEPLRQTTINDRVGLDAESAARLSPVHHQPIHAAPLLLAYGGAESDGFAWQMAELQKAWGKMETLIVPGANHFETLEALAEPGSALLTATLRIMR
ncbi:alpha/beta hydrolase [Magnetospira thiophila]